MLKNKSKLVVFLIAFIMILSTIVYATNIIPGDNTKTTDGTTAVPISETDETNPISEEENTTPVVEEEIYNGDLYLFDSNVVMDKLIDGNVFIMGNDISITGKVNGSLFIFGNNVTIAKDAYIVQGLYVAANSLQLDGTVNDLYAACAKVSMGYNAFAIRDLKVSTGTFDFSGGVGRDAFIAANNFNFKTESGNSALVYGNLTYSAPNELTISKDFVQGNLTYSNFINNSKEDTNILVKVIELCNTVLFTLVLFLLISWLAPKFAAKSSNFINVKEGAVSFGIGLLGFILTFIASFGLLFTIVGIPVAFALIALFILMLSISFAITSTCITFKLKNVFKFDKKYLTVLLLIATSVVLWLLKLIPYVGWVVSIIITLFGFGTIIVYLFTKNSENKPKKDSSKKVNKPVEKKKKEEKE